MITSLDYLRDITENDTVRMKRYVELFLTKSPENIDKLKEAMRDMDYESVRIAAHNLKPQMRSLGVNKGFVLADRIENICIDQSQVEELPTLIEQLGDICIKAIAELSDQQI